MKAIWKYQLDPTGSQIVQLPEGARILCVQTQAQDYRNTICLWALVDPAAPKRDVEIRTHGTGHELPPEAVRYGYLGTYQLQGGALVFHVFRLFSEEETLAAALADL